LRRDEGPDHGVPERARQQLMMRRDLRVTAKDGVAAGAGMAVLLGTTLGLGFSPLLGLGLGAATLIGGVLLADPRSTKEQTEAEARAEVRQALLAARSKVSSIHDLLPKLPNKDVAKKILGICDRADAIVNTLWENPATLLS